MKNLRCFIRNIEIYSYVSVQTMMIDKVVYSITFSEAHRLKAAFE